MRRRFLLILGCGSIGAGLGFNARVVQFLFLRNSGYLHWTRHDLLLLLEAAMVLGGVCTLVYAKWTSGSTANDLRRAMRFHPRKTSALMGLVSMVTLAGVVEVGFLIVNKVGPANKIVSRNTQAQHIEADVLLGFRPQAGARITWTKKVNGRTVFDTVYHIDAANRRVTPSSVADQADTPVLFFGCSFTYGVGVNDDQTMPHQFGLAVPKTAVYNCAFGGYGPQQMLALLQSDRLDPLIQDKACVAIYTFIDDHVRRAIGGMRVVTLWGGRMPFYTLDDQDRPVRQGEFVRDRPMTSMAYAVASRSQFLRFFNVDLPLWLTDSDFRLTARIIEEAQRLVAAKAKKSRFYCMFYPGSKRVAQMRAHFRGDGIRVLDYSNVLDWPNPPYRFVGDSHPTPLAHKMIAQRLAKDIFPTPDSSR